MRRPGGEGTVRAALAAAVVACALFGLAPAAQAATITVDTTADDVNDVNPGSCSVREAVQAAVTNVNGLSCIPVTQGALDPVGRDTIELGAGVGPYALTLPTGPEDLNLNGDIDVGAGGPITITKAGAPATIATGLNDRVFDLRSGATDLTLENLVVDGGDAPNGDNRGGNILVDVDGGTRLTLRGTTVSNGEASSGAGIEVAGAGAQLALTDSVIGGNEARAGGGIFVSLLATGSSTEIVRTRFLDNSAFSAAPNADVQGGGLQHRAGTLAITDSEFTNNEATGTDAAADLARGGGIFATAPFTIRGTLFASNTAESGGAAGEERGGAIEVGFSPSEVGTISNSTFSANSAGENVTPTGLGGAVMHGADGTLQVSQSTFRANRVFGVGGAQALQTEGGPLSVSSSVLAGVGADACSAGVTSGGYNVTDGDPDCGVGPTDATSGALAGLDPSGPQPHGGPTATIALLPGATAIDFVPVAACAAASGVDQRGTSRPLGAACDAGAFELECTTPSALPGCPPLTGTCAGKAATIVGTDGPDTLVGTKGADVIAAGGGKDKARGLGGKDLICGGAGKDRLIGGGGKDKLLGQGGKDKLRGGRGKDLCKGGSGKDRAASCERERSI